MIVRLKITGHKHETELLLMISSSSQKLLDLPIKIMLNCASYIDIGIIAKLKRPLPFVSKNCADRG